MLQRTIPLKVEASDFLIWLYDWFYPKTTPGGHGGYEIKEKETAKAWIDYLLNQQKLSGVAKALLMLHRIDIEQNNASVKIDLSVVKNDQLLSLKVNERVIVPLPWFEVFTFRCYRTGEYRTRVNATCHVPDFTWMLDELWKEINSTFEVIDTEAGAMRVTPFESATSDAKTKLQKPPYQEILEQINFKDTTGWDLTLIEMWNNLASYKEIASVVHESPERVNNRKSELRRMLGSLGQAVLPYDRERRLLILKSRDMK